MAWRVVRSLLTLRDQINAAYPGRSRASDGTMVRVDDRTLRMEHRLDDHVASPHPGR